jgi:putative transposase
MDIFLTDDDRRAYLGFLSDQSKRFGVHYLAWCLMSNHVHLIAVPETKSSLAKGVGEAHKRYTRMVNFREGWRAYLFQGRFFSRPLESLYLLAAIRYVLRNPVRAGIAHQTWDYPWSSARWMIGQADGDPLVRESLVFEEVDDWRKLLTRDPETVESVRRHTRTGRPLGSDTFLEHVETITGRALHLGSPGRKRKK